MNQRSSGAMVIAAGALWGLISLFVRSLTAYGMSALAVVCYRNVFAMVWMGAYLVWKDPTLFRIRLRDLWMFLGTGVVSIALFNLCYFITLTHTSVAVATLLLYTSPVFVMVMATALFHESMTKRKAAALCLTVAGCACVTGIFSQAQSVPLCYLLTGLGSGLFYGLYSIFGKAALRRYRAETVTFYTFVFAAAAALPFTVAECVSVTAAHPAALAVDAGLALFCTVLPFLLYTWGLRGVSAGRAAVFATSEPLVGTVVGIAVFGEHLSVWTVVGIALIVSAILLMNLAPQKNVAGSKSAVKIPR